MAVVIIEALSLFAAGFVEWIATLFPAWNVPAFMAGAGSGLVNLLASFAGFGAWVDFTVLTACIAATGATFAACFIFKLVLKIVAFIPFVGGTG